MIYPRLLKDELLESAKYYPIVTLIGPRQSGKTSLVRDIFSDKPYFNLEAPDVRALIEADPRLFFSQNRDGAILDEIQQAPELLSYLQTVVDEQQKNGLYVLTGSHQLSLHAAITQSLAGRTAVLQLMPFSLQELSNINIDLNLDKWVLHGGYPRVYNQKMLPQRFYRDYLATYIERDVRQLINVKDMRVFQNFLRLCAGRVGQLMNLSQLGNELGMSHNTVKAWLSILEASFVMFRLEPYHHNINKRVVKTPKYYFIDSGLAAYLLGIESEEQLTRDPLRGSLIENAIVSELLKYRLNIGERPNLYFYRDSQGNEVDVIYQHAHQLIPIEIKSSQTFSAHFMKGLTFFKDLLPKQVEEGYLVYGGEHIQKIGNNEVLHFKNAYKCLT